MHREAISLLNFTSGDGEQNLGPQQNAASSQSLSQAGALEVLEKLNDGPTVHFEELHEMES